MEALSPIELGLKAKGIGPKGLKPLDREVLDGIFAQFESGEIPEELLGAFLMGFRVLERDPEQLAMLEDALAKVACPMSPSLVFVCGVVKEEVSGGVKHWISALKKSMELTPEDCKGVVDYLLDPMGEPVFKAALLQGFRVKRETDRENTWLLNRLLEMAPRVELSVPSVVDLSEPYDGMVRSENLALELAILLSLSGERVVLHGVRGLGPKYGCTILDQVDPKVHCDLELGKKALEEVGVAILDQEKVWPAMFQLLKLRNAIRKRPFLATMEKMAMPLRGEKTLLVTGYVHSAYRDSIPAMLLDNNHSSFLLVKGLEGGVQLKGGAETTLFHMGGEAVCSRGFTVGMDGEGLPWPPEAGLFGTVQAILEFGLGRKVAPSKMEDMKAMMVDGRFQGSWPKSGDFTPKLFVGDQLAELSYLLRHLKT